MKKTLALLIAVVMVVAILPLSVMTVAGEVPDPSADDKFALYNASGEFVAYYTTLTDVSRALQNNYTLKLLVDFEQDTAFAWNRRVTFTIDGNNKTITYTGLGKAWSFETSGREVVLKNINVVCTNGAAVFEASKGSVLNIESGSYVSNGSAVMRVKKGTSSSTPTTLNVYGGEFILNPSNKVSNLQASDAVITNDDGGNVYIYGGTIVNNNDAVNGTVRSEYALYQASDAGSFQIFGGVLMATGAQRGFFKPAKADGGAGIALPTVEIPIVKGMTAMREFNGREYYYTVYGAGELLLVPALAPAVRAQVVLASGGETVSRVDLVFVTELSADLAAAINTWALDKADGETFALNLGTVITTEKTFLEAGGFVEGVLGGTKGSVADLLAGNANTYVMFNAQDFDVVEKDNGDCELLATFSDFDPDLKEMSFVAVPFLELTVGSDAKQTWYGEFSTAGASTMADAAANALRDNTAVADDLYQYPSITLANHYSSQKAVQQQALVEYLAHEHSFDFSGACLDADCTESVSRTLTEGEAAPLYTENGSVSFFEIVLDAGVRYTVALSDDVASYEIFDEDGARCTVSAGSFTAAAEGTYYLRASGKKTGTAMLTVAHAHILDYLGECSVCEESFVIELPLEFVGEDLVVKGNTYVFAFVLEADVSYMMRAINGTFVLYNEQGDVQPLRSNVFSCTEDGTYYMVVTATYTGVGTVYAEHVHAYDYRGVCTQCADDFGVQLNAVDEYSTAQAVLAGDTLYFHITLEAGNTYKLESRQYVGRFELYDATGAEISLTSSSTFACAADGVYYVKLSARNDIGAQVRVALVPAE